VSERTIHRAVRELDALGLVAATAIRGRGGVGAVMVEGAE
jgi:hypothetical protein